MPYPPHNFSIKELPSKVNPKIEILKNGNQFWDDLPGAKKPFKFDVYQAKRLLASMSVIKEFLSHEGRRPSNPDWRIIPDHDDCLIKRIPKFTIKGKKYDNPYLEIGGLAGKLYLKKGRINEINGEIGFDDIDWEKSEPSDPVRFGLLKADALIILEKDIESFINRMK